MNLIKYNYVKTALYLLLTFEAQRLEIFLKIIVIRDNIIETEIVPVNFRAMEKNFQSSKNGILAIRNILVDLLKASHRSG